MFLVDRKITSLLSITDFSFLYNPLFYPNSLFWPSTFLLPYQNAAAATAAGIIGAPISPNLNNMRDYTLTPEKDDVPGK